ncbi:MAG: sigma-70 family RNA polymerase sigma factor [Paraglaciecola sp.]|nr:sigma-70 family RNA polymerase sigma factor [Paraglaciecola sp.]NCT49412.1 sigma-70 family RNA polymerase sigma factor [Paraglaciecola sp.]
MEHEEHLRLLGKVTSGDEQAFAQLYEATSPQLYAICLKMLRRKEWAEDAVQDAYVKIWHNAGEYRGGLGTVLTWMVSIARYRALDMLRFYKVRKEEEIEDNILLSDDDVIALSAEDKKQLNVCLDELEETQKQAIHLAFYCGLSHQEVTHHLDAPLGSTKSMIRRGLQLLKRCLGI